LSPRLPDIADLGHGIGVIPLPLPFDSPAWVNAYVIRTATGTTLIDCGVDWEPGLTRLLDGLAVLEIEPGSIRTIVVSHLHPDHVGMAPRVVALTGATLTMHRKAIEHHLSYNDTPGLQRWLDEFGRLHGVPTDQLAAFAALDRPAWMPFIGPPDTVVEDGDRIDLGDGRHLEVLHTPGHEHSHICLVDSRTGILFSGDHILPRITPVIMWDQTELDVLGLYLESVHRLTGDKFGLTYPAHGSIVERGSQRAEQIELHHERRLQGMLELVRLGPATGWGVMLESFRPHLNPMEQRLALRETVSHLEHLRVTERIASFDDAVRYYRRM
jgi:glyoxylase-like metal-dependent hydrolase (beta-lactamase superfamily II)